MVFGNFRQSGENTGVLVWVVKWGRYLWVLFSFVNSYEFGIFTLRRVAGLVYKSGELRRHLLIWWHITWVTKPSVRLRGVHLREERTQINLIFQLRICTLPIHSRDFLISADDTLGRCLNLSIMSIIIQIPAASFLVNWGQLYLVRFFTMVPRAVVAHC